MATIPTPLDFRSDTFTRPGPGMRKAMSEAEVGDDVFGEDPTVNRLEARVAELFGRQAALFVPSGTMANLIGLAIHCARGDEVVMEGRTHSFSHEVGGGAALLGVLFHPLDAPAGYLEPEQVAVVIRPTDVHEPITRLVIVENTANLCGGKVVPLRVVQAMRQMTLERGLRLHLDGARIWNASIAAGIPLSDWAAQVDSLSCCLSKGLGCPAGSLVIGDRDEIQKARWYRKMLGGGMRQAGVLAACGLYALEHNLSRLCDDHAMASELAAGLSRILPDDYQVEPPESNMVVVHTRDQDHTRSTIENWSKLGVRCLPVSDKTIRLVTHMDLPTDAAGEAVDRIERQLG